MIHGVGINDAPYQVNTRRQGGILCPFYATWGRMIERCYSKREQERHPTYQGCSVVTEWHSFMNFKAWMEKQEWEDKQLDKDLLIKGNKVYGPETCIFISRQLNSFMTESTASRGDLPIGVTLRSDGKKYVAQCCGLDGKNRYLGSFDCSNAAHNKYTEVKKEHAKHHILLQTDIRIKDAIVKWYNIEGVY